MNTQQINAYKAPRPTWFTLLTKMTSPTNPIEIRQVLIIIRIMISIFIIGLLGYTWDRVMQSRQHRSS